MNKVLTELWMLAMAALIALPCFSASPAPANPYFSWRTLDQAQEMFAASNTATTAESCVFFNLNCTLIFHNGSRKAEIDDVTVWLNMAPDLSPSFHQWQMAAIDMDLISLMILAVPEEKPQPLKIVLDPGHGGDDSGAITRAGDLYEKDINLELAQRVGKILRRKGLKVRFTRDKDTTLTLNERSAIARKEKADLFVSIHANKASNTNASGVETYVLTPSGYHGTAEGSPPRGWQIGNKNDYNNNLLGYAIHKQLTQLDQTSDRGLKRQSFFVLRETHCPAALIEAGFLSNPDEARRMKEHTWQNGCADRIAAGIIDYCHKVNSLNQAVADKRKKDAEANERWKDYLVQKEEEQRLKTDAFQQVAENKSLLLAAASKIIIQPEAAAAQTQDIQPVKADDSKSKASELSAPPAIDLPNITDSQVQSVATNIYLKNARLDTPQDSGTEGLRKLAEFYETGKVK